MKYLHSTAPQKLGRLNRMVSDFLSYGRQARITLREVNARGMIEEVMSLVRARADREGQMLSSPRQEEAAGRRSRV